MMGERPQVRVEVRLVTRPADLEDVLFGLFQPEVGLLHRPAGHRRDRGRRRKAMVEDVGLVVDLHRDLTRLVGVEDRMSVAVKRTVMVQRFRLVVPEDQELSDIGAALAEDTEEIGDERGLAELEAGERLGFDGRRR